MDHHGNFKPNFWEYLGLEGSGSYSNYRGVMDGFSWLVLYYCYML
jgi:hypothetical protein